jgi:hypothetical protein
VNLDIDTTAAEWIAAKDLEKAAVERRRELEDHILSLIGVSEDMEGTETVETDGDYKIKLTGRMNRKVDVEMLRELATDAGVSEHLETLFRWKAEINTAAWKYVDAAITKPLLRAITTKPGRVSVSITKEE